MYFYQYHTGPVHHLSAVEDVSSISEINNNNLKIESQLNIGVPRLSQYILL